MPSAADKVEDVQAKVEQSKGAKRATLDLMRSKKRVEKTVTVIINGEEASFLFRSISAKEYDRLLTDNPPNLEQRAAGAPYNINTFAPALLARVIAEPEINEDHWTEIWTSPDWNRGELMGFFAECVDLCNAGLKLGPTELG